MSNDMLNEARDVIANLVEILIEEGLGDITEVEEAKWLLDKTQPELYVVQFRSMRTAIHNIAILEERSTANYLLGAMANEEAHPDVVENVLNTVVEAGLFTIKEIDYRNPPKEIDGYKLIYMNDYIPDVYCLG